jgi:hypothetical protein
MNSYPWTIVLLLALLSCAAANGSNFDDVVAAGEKPKVRVPTFKYDKKKEGGCANVFLYKMTADDTEALVIRVDKKKLKLPAKGSVKFDLAKPPEGLMVEIDLWERAPRFRRYCNDIADDTKREANWKAKKGTLTLTMFEPGPNEGSNYKVSARLDGVVFEDGAGNEATLKQETISEALVGWFAG